MPIYRPQAATIGSNSGVSSSIFHKDFELTTMFTAASVELNINIVISGLSRTLPIIYASEGDSGINLGVTIKKIIK